MPAVSRRAPWIQGARFYLRDMIVGWCRGAVGRILKSPGGDPISRVQQDDPSNRSIICLMDLNRSAG